MSRQAERDRRSECPVNAFVETFGDRWSLLIVRDLMLRGARTYKELQASEEGIASNILADRIGKLEAAAIVEAEADAADGRRRIYRLTEKGVSLAPVLVSIVVWAAQHEETGTPPELLERLRKRPAGFIAEVRRRWADRSTTPVL